MATINTSGTWRDSTMADYGVYDKMEEMYARFGVQVVVDSAFNLQNKPYLIRSAQVDPIGTGTGVSLNRAATA